MIELVVDSDLQKLIPPLDPEERRLLEKSIVADGCRHPLIVWESDDQRVLVDGHNRYDICRKHQLDFDIEIEPFEDRTQVILWMINNQMGRRNLADIDRINLARRKEDIVKLKAKANKAANGGDKKSELAKSPTPIESKIDTRKEVAKVAGVGEKTYDAGKKILEAVESGELEPSVVDEIRSGEKSINGAFKELKQSRKRQHVVEVVSNDLPPGAEIVDDLFCGKSFTTIYADPPWQYGNQSTRASTDNHYSTMTIEDICELPVSQIVEDKAVLFLWTTNGFLEDALTRVIPSWGFTFKSSIVWVKPQMGIGNYVRNAHEFLLIANRGGMIPNGKSQISWHQADRTKHSEKPDAFRHIIEKMVPQGERLEMFARNAFPGWTSWGNQVQEVPCLLSNNA